MAGDISPMTQAVLHYVGPTWSAIGPLIGVLVGGWITTRTQRKHWILDNKKAEYSELISTIADSGSKLLVFWGMEPVVANPEEQFQIGETARKSVDVIYNRLFIANEILKLKIQDRWETAISKLRKTRDLDEFGKTMDGIIHDLRTAALKDFGS